MFFMTVSYTHLDVYKRQGLYLAREDEQICLLYYQVFVGMLEININSAEVLYKQKEKTINE